MKVLFITRKNSSDKGGLSRFVYELTANFSYSFKILAVKKPFDYIIPFTNNFDIIHLTDATLLPFGLLIKTLFHKPIIITAHGLDITYPNPFYQHLLRTISPKAHAVVVGSNPVSKLLKISPIKINQQKIIPPGLSISHFNYSKKILLPKKGTNSIILLTVGNLVKRKGHVWFITHVFSKLPDNYLYYIIGNGPEKKLIKSIIKKLDLSSRIFLFDNVNNAELAYIFSKSDIYLCPNQKIKDDFEGFGIAAGEAAAMGLPVIASNVDGICAIIHHEKNGLLIKPNAIDFIKAIDTLSSQSYRKALGKKAKKYTLANFSWQKTTREYASLFKEVIDKTK